MSGQIKISEKLNLSDNTSENEGGGLSDECDVDSTLYYKYLPTTHHLTLYTIVSSSLKKKTPKSAPTNRLNDRTMTIKIITAVTE